MQEQADIRTGGGPVIERVDVRVDDDGGLSVWPVWRGVDRPDVSGMAVRDRRMAGRLVAAIEAGKVLADARVKRGTDGRTYVAARWLVLSRMLNADLRQLGF
jgi:hypothetical protein